MSALPASTMLSAARLYACRKAPYFGAAIRKLAPVASTQVGLKLAVTESGVLSYNEAWVQAQRIPYLATVLLGETLHLLFRHAPRCRALGITPGTEQAQLFEKAADMSVNAQLKEGGWDIGEGVLPDHEQFAPGLPAEAYYQLLLAKHKPNPQQGGGGQGGTGSAPMNGDNGGAAGGHAPEQLPLRDDREWEQAAQDSARAIQAGGKGIGTMPAGWSRWAGDKLAPPVVRWQDKLSRVIRGVVARQMGHGHKTYTKRSRLQEGIGYGPGKPLLPGDFAQKPQVAVAIDTSGSMSDEVLGQAMGEVNAVCKAAGAPVLFCACDAEVHAGGLVRNWKDVKKNLKGGGGTDFVPAFEYLLDQKHKGVTRPTLLVFVTDGYGRAPETKPRNVDVVWLITEGGVKPCDWGDAVMLKDTGG